MKTKKQFINRILSLLLALVMVIGMLPITALAANNPNLYVAGVTAINDAAIINSKPVEHASVSYDSASNSATITLNGVNTDKHSLSGYGGAIEAYDLSHLYIVLADNSENNFEVSWWGGDYISFIYAACPVTISGNGTLNVTMNNISGSSYGYNLKSTWGIRCTRGTLTICDGANVNFALDVNSYSKCYGIEAGNAVLRNANLSMDIKNKHSSSTTACLSGTVSLISGSLSMKTNRGDIGGTVKAEGATVSTEGGTTTYTMTPHEWTYSSSGNAINAWCSKSNHNCAYFGEEKALALTITAEDTTYKKEDITTTNTIEIMGGSYEITTTNSFSTKYPGATLNNLISAIVGGSAATITYIGRGETSYSSATPPSNAGTYTAKVELGGASATDDFIIAKADLSYTAPTAKDALTYQDTAQQLINAGSVTTKWYNINQPSPCGRVEYRLGTTGEWSTDIPTAQEVGTYQVYWRVVPVEDHAANYAMYEPSEPITVSIAALDMETISVLQDGKLTYDGGKALTPAVSTSATTVNNQTITFTYSKEQNGTYGSMPTFTKAGTYTVYFKAAALNHKDYYGSFTVTVDKANVTHTAPTANDLTYTGSAQNLITIGEAKGGEMQYSTDNQTWSTTIPKGTDADTYDVWYKVVGDSNHNDLAPACVTVVIDKADQAAPAGIGKADETIAKKADGKITGVDSTMEYRAEGESTYTAITGSAIENLAAGKYYVRIKGDSNHNPSPETEVIIATGRKLTVKVPQNQVGYKLTTTTPEMDWYDTLYIEFELLDGYSMLDYFEIYNGNEPMWQHFNQQTGVLQLNFVGNDFDFTVKGVKDITPPAVEIKVKENKWTSFWNNLTFGLFFKETQDVTITAADVGSGVKNIQYYLSGTELERDEVMSITNWIDYNGIFKINPDNRYVIYAKVTDNDGNVEYINSDGIVLDATAPVIEGIENGKTYYTTQSFTVKESNLESVTVNGNPSMTVALSGNVDKEYVVVATDKAGNSTTVTVTMKPIKDLAEATENLGNDNVTSADAPALKELVEKLDELIADPDTSDNGERETLEQHKVIAESLLNTIEDAAKATDTDNTQKVEDVTAENVTPKDKLNLEKAKDDLEKALNDYADNLTEDEKKVIEDEIERIHAALEVIGNVEAAEGLISNLPDTIKKDDAVAIKAANEAFDALSDYEKSLVDKNAKKALEDAKAALARLNKSDDALSPATGDNSNLWLWVALMFVSGTGIFGITLCDRKRRTTSKR